MLIVANRDASTLLSHRKADPHNTAEMKQPLLDLAEDLSAVDRETSALAMDVNVISSADSDNEQRDESVTSDTDTSEPEVLIDPEEAKKKAQDAAFTKHLEYLQSEEKHESTPGAESKSAIFPTKGFEFESKKIIDQARDYQQEMFERAKAENVIAVYVDNHIDCQTC